MSSNVFPLLFFTLFFIYIYISKTKKNIYQHDQTNNTRIQPRIDAIAWDTIFRFIEIYLCQNLCTIFWLPSLPISGAVEWISLNLKKE